LYLAVPSLPRMAKIEWQVMLRASEQNSPLLTENEDLNGPTIWKESFDNGQTRTQIATWCLSPILSGLVVVSLSAELREYIVMFSI